jgi:hypothetical protein
MRAIDRMAAIFADPYMLFSFAVMACGEVLVPAEEVVKIARRLALEEAKEKPTAPASLVEAIEAYCKEAEENGHYITEEDLRPILSRYRPAPSRTEKPDIVCPACDFEGEEVKVCPSCGTPEKGKASFAGIAPDRTGELVKRLRDLRDGHLWSDAIEDDWRAAEREMAKKIDEILRDFEGGA